MYEWTLRTSGTHPIGPAGNGRGKAISEQIERLLSKLEPLWGERGWCFCSHFNRTRIHHHLVFFVDSDPGWTLTCAAASTPTGAAGVTTLPVLAVTTVVVYGKGVVGLDETGRGGERGGLGLGGGGFA